MSAKDELNQHLRGVIQWHFSEETGCPCWLDWLKTSGWDPREKIQSVEDLPQLDLFLDGAVRRQPAGLYDGDGVGDARPFGARGKKILEGVY